MSEPTSAPMELLPITQGELEADAILQVGHTGEIGFAALGPILCGDVNPSARTVDIWPADFTKDPTYQNFGEFTYTNATFSSHTFGSPSSANEDGTFNRYFVEYEEGVYNGYRFYETAAAVDESYVYGVIDEGGKVTEAGGVVYPFGYGLSYTTFEQTIKSYSDQGDAIAVEVEVKNTGKAAGKDVAELYYGAPYTDLDIEMKIEKPVTVLGDFAKTDVLEPGYIAATNRFQECSDYMNTEATILTRADWKSTFPTMPENRSKAVGDTYVASFGIEETFDPQTDPLLGNTETSIYADAAEVNVKDLGLKVSDMRGIPYNDAKWDEFLSQIDLTNAKERAAVVKMMTVSNYATYGVEAVGLPPTREADGAGAQRALLQGF